MTKTLADFKRAIHTGMEITMTKREERAWSNEEHGYAGELYQAPIADKLQGPRCVSYIDTTGFYLKRSDDKSMRGSFCGWPKARDLQFDGNTFAIIDRGSKDEIYQVRHYRMLTK